MKRFIGFLAAALLLASCQVPVGVGGTLRVVLPSSSTSRATLANSTSVRLQLTRNGVIVPLSGGDFIEKSLSGQTVSIDGLPPGAGYVLFVSTGHSADGETFYRTDLFQKSDPFEISAGTNTAVTVTLNTSRVAVMEAAPNAGHGATVKGGSPYYINGASIMTGAGAVQNWTSSTTFNVNGAGWPAGTTVLGLSNDGSALWLNTDHGISFGSAFSSPSTSMLDQDSHAISPVVTSSGAATVGGQTFAYYFGSGLTAGLRVKTETNWSTMDGLLDFDSSLKSKLNGNIIRGIATTSDFAVLATSIGAFRVVDSMLSGTASDLGKDLTSGTVDGTASGASIEIQPSDNTLLLGAVSAVADSSSQFVFGGTPKGLYANSADVNGAPTGGTLNLVAGTQGLNITKLVTLPTLFGGNAYTAAYSAGTREVLILRNQTVIDRVAAFEGLPSGDLKLSLYQSGSVYLLVAGSDATVQIAISGT